MDLTGKQKRFLRSKAHHLAPIFQIGKNLLKMKKLTTKDGQIKCNKQHYLK